LLILHYAEQFFPYQECNNLLSVVDGKLQLKYTPASKKSDMNKTSIFILQELNFLHQVRSYVVIDSYIGETLVHA